MLRQSQEARGLLTLFSQLPEALTVRRDTMCCSWASRIAAGVPSPLTPLGLCRTPVDRVRNGGGVPEPSQWAPRSITCMDGC